MPKDVTTDDCTVNKWLDYVSLLDHFQKAKNGLNEIKRIYLVKWSELIKPVEPGDILGKVIIIDKKKYKLRYNLNRYIEEKVILDILNKNL